MGRPHAIITSWREGRKRGRKRQYTIDFGQVCANWWKAWLANRIVKLWSVYKADLKDQIS